jgi:hypothetical protein
VLLKTSCSGPDALPLAVITASINPARLKLAVLKIRALRKTGNGERGAGNREQGTGNREPKISTGEWEQ